MNIILPLCGLGNRFIEAGFSDPKPLIDVFDKKMIFHVLENLHFSANDKVFIVYHTSLENANFSNIIKTKMPGIELIPIYIRTAGAAETVLFGIEHILTNNLTSLNDVLVVDCDTIYNVNIIKKLKKLDSNAVVYFEDSESKPIYSYIKLKNDILIDIIEKEKISNCANTGAYYFKNIIELKNGCKYIIDNNIKFKNEYYISCVIKHMITSGNIFKGLKINRENYISLGTPDELNKFKEQHYSFLFDLDGTLVKTDYIYFKVWSEILEEFNIVLTDEIFNKYISGNSDLYVMEHLQIDNTTYDIHALSQLKDKLFSKHIDNIVIVEGARAFIKNIKKLGHSISVVTNCNRATCEEILKHVNIYKYIQYIIIGNECLKPKPYPDPYLMAIKLMKTTKDKCIIFEDSKPGLLSALAVAPRNIVGVDNGTNTSILQELNIKTIINNFINIPLNDILNTKNDVYTNITNMIMKSLLHKYNIKTIHIDISKLKGGYISDVIKVGIYLTSGEILDCVLKYENDYTSTLTKMAYKLGLFDREYYFYENISSYININIPRYIGTMKDSNFVSKGILLENINKDDFFLNLDLNKESIDVSLKVIEECAKFHGLFWNKDLSKSFPDLKKHNNSMFKPVWGNFIRERWAIFIDKWRYLLTDKTLLKLQDLVNRFDEVQEYLSQDNLTLCHGDVKSGNIFYKKADNIYMPYFIDWQYIAHGKGVQDIVFFIIESFSIEHIKEYNELFKKYYYVKLKENGVIDYHWDNYIKDFENAVCYFPFFVAIWFGTTPNDELIDVSFPDRFIQKFLYFIDSM